MMHKAHLRVFVEEVQMLARLIREECGQDIMEYGLLASFISVSVIGVLRLIGPLIVPFYQSVVDALS